MSIISNKRDTTTPAQAIAGRLWKLHTNTTPVREAQIDELNTVPIPYLGEWFTSNPADFTGTNVATAQPVFNTTEDTLTVPALTSWMFKARYHIHTTGTTSHQLGILFGGTATLTSIGYDAWASNAATEVLGTPQVIPIVVATVINVSPATATATHHSVILEGIVRFNAGGTFIPQYQWSAAPGVAGVTLANSYFKMKYLGANTIAAVGPWA